MALHLAIPLPKGAEYLASLAEEIGPKHGISPYLILGICYAESNFGLALKPPGPAGTGDFIARVADKDTNERMAKSPLPGVQKKHLAEGIKARGIKTPVDAWVPTTTGWGMGLFQIDFESHFDFCKSGDWADARKAMEYACKLLSGNQKYLASKAGLTGATLVQATVGSYNAGAGRIAKFLAEKKDLDSATFHPGYIKKICDKADALAGHSGAYIFKAA